MYFEQNLLNLQEFIEIKNIKSITTNFCEHYLYELLDLEHLKSFCHKYHNRFVLCGFLCASVVNFDLQNFCCSRDKDMVLVLLTNL